MLCRGRNISLYTLNGELVLEQNICTEGEDTIVSCAFYEGLGNDYPERELIFTGHKRGVVNVSRLGSLFVWIKGSTNLDIGLEQGD